MGTRKSAGQRRAATVLARTRRGRGGGTVCGGTRRGAPAARVPAPRSRERDALDALLEADVEHVPHELMDEAVLAAVRRTLVERSARPGELLAARFREIDATYADADGVGDHCACCEHYADSDDGPGEWASLALLRWLIAARVERGGPGLAGEVVGWVGTQLDRRGRRIQQRARHLGGPGAPAARTVDEICELVREVLEQDEVAVLVWLVSGVVAVAGGGEVAWLRDVEARAFR